jgi:hypothetical protein
MKTLGVQRLLLILNISLALNGCASTKWGSIGMSVTIGCVAGGGTGGAIVWQDRRFASGIGCGIGVLSGMILAYSVYNHNEEVYGKRLSLERTAIEKDFSEKLVKVMEASKKKPALTPVLVDEKVQNGRYMPPRVDWELESK